MNQCLYVVALSASLCMAYLAYIETPINICADSFVHAKPCPTSSDQARFADGLLGMQDNGRWTFSSI